MRLIALFACIGLTAAGTGCVVAPDNGPVETGASDETLSVDWTINGSTDPNECNQSSADTLEVTVEPGGSFEQSCAAFITTISLAPGRYSASAVLLDPNGHARTTSVPINPFTIIEGTDLDIPIDFPANSFF